jgi:hypothetical protein
MVYSTCSLNPIENEAVVAALLLHARGNLQLVNPTPILPKLKYRPGIHTWSGAVDTMVAGDEDAEESIDRMPPMHASMRPPSVSNVVMLVTLCCYALSMVSPLSHHLSL